MNIEFILNGLLQKISITSVERAVDVLVKQCGIESISGTCLNGSCGTCLILLEGKPVYSCILPAFLLKDAHIETIENFQNTKEFPLILSELKNVYIDASPFQENALLLLSMYLIKKNIMPSQEELIEAFANAHFDAIVPQTFYGVITRVMHQLSTVRKTP
jgi:carbon-monoxide dehydrogenase small subunit